MALGRRIREERERRDWTLEQLAEASGVEIGTISALENRDSQRTKFVGQIATAFGISIEELTSGDPAATQLREQSRVSSGTAQTWPFSIPKSAYDAMSTKEKAALDLTVSRFILGCAISHQAAGLKNDSIAQQVLSKTGLISSPEAQEKARKQKREEIAPADKKD